MCQNEASFDEGDTVRERRPVSQLNISVDSRRDKVNHCIRVAKSRKMFLQSYK